MCILCIVHFISFSSHLRSFPFFRSMNESQMEGDTSKRRKKKLTKQVDISKNLFYVFLTFVICLIPHSLAEIFNANAVVISQTKLLVVCNSFVNPILYGFKHPHFRDVFTCILQWRWQDIPRPSWILKTTFQLSQSQSHSNMTSNTRNDEQATTI